MPVRRRSPDLARRARVAATSRLFGCQVGREALVDVRNLTLCYPGSARGVEQTNEYGVWRVWRGSELRLIQGAYEEGMVVSLDSPDLAGRVGACDAHPVFAGDVLQLGRQPIRAGGVLDGNEVAVEPRDQGAGCEFDGDCLVLERTSKQSDDGRPSQAVLSVGGISYPSKSPSVLDQHVLKATSGAN
jgi:hypothetical protein